MLQSLSYALDSKFCPKEHKSARAEASSRSPAIQHLAVTDLLSSQTPLFTSETTACGIFGKKTVDYGDLLAQRNVAISSERALPPAAAPTLAASTDHPTQYSISTVEHRDPDKPTHARFNSADNKSILSVALFCAAVEGAAIKAQI